MQLRRKTRTRIRTGKVCGAKRRRIDATCLNLPLANGRCKWHGGMATGAKTPEGKARALQNLWWYKRRSQSQSEGRDKTPADSDASAPQCANSVRDQDEPS